MPKRTKDPIRAMSGSLRESQIKFVERAGVGENFSAKLRSLIDRLMDSFDKIAGKEGSTLIYEQKDGEKIWSALIPFELKRRDWRSIADDARKAGFVTEIKEDKEIGSVEVWCAASKRLTDCDTCRAQVKEAMHG